MLICSACGVSVETFAKGKRCRTCYNAYMAEYILKRYHRRRTEAVAELGGVCVQCGSTDRLEFDHRDRKSKSGSIDKWFTQGEAKYREELRKCQLLCIHCHRKKTVAESSVGHGGGLTGMKNCYCEKCKPLKQQYARERRRNKGR